MFNKLYGDLREFVLETSKLSENNALQKIAQRYNGEICSTLVMGAYVLVHHSHNTKDAEIEKMIKYGYFENKVKVDGGWFISLTDDFRNYDEMERRADGANSIAQTKIEITGDNNAVQVGNTSSTQTVNKTTSPIKWISNILKKLFCSGAK